MTDDDFKISRRHLPHWNLKEAVYFITFNTKETSFSENEIDLVLKHIVDDNNKFYFLFSAVVMPEHVHLILKPIKNYSLSRILKGIKGASARKINKIRNSKGSLWQSESYDRIIRDEGDLFEKLNYMLNNPLKRGLVANPYKYHGLYINKDMLS
jgi:REP element-mobilizing transposase RayT